MRLTRDDEAASPLVVLTTFVLVAILLTVIVYAVAFDRPEDRVELVVVDDGALAFDVTRTGGGLAWHELTVRFLDRAGTDQAGVYLHVPNGTVSRGDRITVQPQPPAGTYLLLVLHGGDELSRLRVDL